MKNRIRGLATVAGATSVMILLGNGVSGADVVRARDAAIDVPIDGGCHAQIASTHAKYNSVLPLSGNPFTRELFLTNYGHVKFVCKNGGKAPSGFVIEVGYQIAPNADVSDGLHVGVTPKLSLTGATAGQITEVQTPIDIKLKAGSITEVAAAKREFKKDDKGNPPPTSANINLNNWHAQLNNAAGFISIRSYVKVISSGKTTDDINVVYGPAVVLR